MPLPPRDIGISLSGIDRTEQNRAESYRRISMTYLFAGLWDTVFQKVAILTLSAFILGFIFSILVDREGALKDRLVNGVFQGIAGVGSSLGCIL